MYVKRHKQCSKCKPKFSRRKSTKKLKFRKRNGKRTRLPRPRGLPRKTLPPQFRI